MRILIVDDDAISRLYLKNALRPIGSCDLAASGAEALHAFRAAHDSGNPYSLVCLDVMMPVMGGQETLKLMRILERERGVSEVDGVTVVMTSALGDPGTVVEAMFKGGATSYLVKPIHKRRLLEELRDIKMIP